MTRLGLEPADPLQPIVEWLKTGDAPETPLP